MKKSKDDRKATTAVQIHKKHDKIGSCGYIGQVTIINNCQISLGVYRVSL